MDAVSTVTQKGQVTIPLFIRESFGMEPKTRVVFIKDKDKVYFKPARNFLDLAGSIKTKNPFNITKMKKAARKFISEKYAKGS